MARRSVGAHHKCMEEHHAKAQQFQIAVENSQRTNGSIAGLPHGRWVEGSSCFSPHLDESWDEVVAVFKEVCMRNRRMRMKPHTFCGGLCGDLDWSLSQKMQKKGTNRDAIARRTWHQAALVTHEGAQYKECPHCKVEATPVHLLCLQMDECKSGPFGWSLEEGDRIWSKHGAMGKGLQLPAWQVQTGKPSLAKWGTWHRGPAQIAEGECVTLVHHRGPYRVVTSWPASFTTMRGLRGKALSPSYWQGSRPQPEPGSRPLCWLKSMLWAMWWCKFTMFRLGRHGKVNAWRSSTLIEKSSLG